MMGTLKRVSQKVEEYDWACGASYIGEFKEGLRDG